MKRAIIYVRVSTARQADEGISIDAQTDQCKKKAKELGASVLQIFRDEGVTGTSAMKRQAFQRAIHYCAVNDVDYFIVWSTSRFARNKLDAASYKLLLRESGTRLVYASMNIDSDTDEGWFTDSIMEIMDEQVSRQISRDTRRAMLKNAEEGWFNGGRAPFGYQIMTQNKRRKLVPNDAEKTLVQEAFRRFAAGESALAIARSFTSRGYTRRGAEWQAASLSHMLKNRVYLGQTVYNKTSNRKTNPPEDWVIRQTHEPLLSEEEFENAQRRFQPRHTAAGSPSSSFLFTGLLRCGRCGKAMVIETATSKTKRRYNYYNCSGARKGCNCIMRRIPAEKIDNYLLNIVIDKLLTQDVVSDFISKAYQKYAEKRAGDAQQRKLLQSELTELRRRRNALFELVESGLTGSDSRSLLERLAGYDEREQILLIELDKLDSAPSVEKIPEIDIDSALTTLKNIILNTRNAKKLRILLQSFIQKIDVNPTDVVIHYHPERVIHDSTGVHSTKGWHAHGDSNPGCRRERAVS